MLRRLCVSFSLLPSNHLNLLCCFSRLGSSSPFFSPLHPRVFVCVFPLLDFSSPSLCAFFLSYCSNPILFGPSLLLDPTRTLSLSFHFFFLHSSTYLISLSQLLFLIPSLFSSSSLLQSVFQRFSIFPVPDCSTSLPSPLDLFLHVFCPFSIFILIYFICVCSFLCLFVLHFVLR